MAEAKLNIAICGGGISGLTLALALCKFSKEPQDIKVDIYEANSELIEIGAGVAMWLRPWRVLCELGLEEDLKVLLDHPIELIPRAGRCWEYRKADQTDGVSYYELVVPIGILGFHRAQLLEVLASHLDQSKVTIHFSKSLSAYSQDGPSTRMEFTDGSNATADVLVGSDGIHSVVRHQLLLEAVGDLEGSSTDEDHAKSESLLSSIEPVWTGMKIYRNVIRREELASKNPDHRALSRPVFYSGKGSMLVTYPISNGALVNVATVIFVPEKAGSVYDGELESTEENMSKLVKHFESWEEELRQIVSCFKSSKVWVIKKLNPLPISVRGPVALVGDAAHAMAPSQGAGAGQAIEDAYVLAGLLAHPRTTRETLHTALKVYDSIRLPHANEVMRRSTLTTEIASFTDPRFSRLSEIPPDQLDIGDLWDLGHALATNLKWAWTTTVASDLTKAVELLKEQTLALGP